jgi:hypothetical protein
MVDFGTVSHGLLSFLKSLAGPIIKDSEAPVDEQVFACIAPFLGA